jgi:hypothetical protein
VRAALAERKGVNAQLLAGFEVREGRYLLGGRELPVRFMDNAEKGGPSLMLERPPDVLRVSLVRFFDNVGN